MINYGKYIRRENRSWVGSLHGRPVQSRREYVPRAGTSLWFSVYFSPNIKPLPDGTVPQEA